MHKKLNKLKEQYNLGEISFSELVEQSYQLGLNDNEATDSTEALKKAVEDLLNEKKKIIEALNRSIDGLQSVVSCTS